MIQIPRLESGVYHLILNKKVVYVGASSMVLMRLDGWNKTAIKFDSVVIFPCPVNGLAEMERQHLEAHKPPLNIYGVTRPYCNNVGWDRWPKNDNAIKYLSRIDQEIIGASELAFAKEAPNRKIALAMVDHFDFPKPVKTIRGKNGKLPFPKWKRTDVLHWLTNQETEA